MEVVEIVPPPLIDDGLVAQVLVEYVGRKAGTVRYRPPSGRSYPFSANGSARLRYVPAEDASYFGRTSDFRVHTESWHDPAVIERRATEATARRLDEEVQELRARLGKPRSGARIGRPAVKVDDNILAWHLMHHCGWTREQVATELDLKGKDPAGAMGKRLLSYKNANPNRLDESVCRYCRSGHCPPPPE